MYFIPRNLKNFYTLSYLHDRDRCVKRSIEIDCFTSQIIQECRNLETNLSSVLKMILFRQICFIWSKCAFVGIWNWHCIFIFKSAFLEANPLDCNWLFIVFFWSKFASLKYKYVNCVTYDSYVLHLLLMCYFSLSKGTRYPLENIVSHIPPI